MNSMQEIKIANLNWVNLTSLKKEDLDELGKNFNLLPEDLEDCLPPPQRSKLIERENYLFMVLLFPIYNAETNDLRPSEIDFFIKKDVFISVHANEIEPLKDIFHECLTQPQNSICSEADNPSLLHSLLNRLLSNSWPILKIINAELDIIEEQLLRDLEKPNQQMLQKILHIKTNLVAFRKSMQGHKNAIEKLMAIGQKYFPTVKLKTYFNDLEEQTDEIWNLLENYEDIINALHDTYTSFINFRTNQVIKTLTIFSVIVFPLTLLAAIFGMNAKLPLVELEGGFWYIVGIMAAGVLAMLVYFRKKKWI